MANDFSNFIEEVWSKKLGMNFDNSGVAMGVVNRKWEGEIKASGDTVHIVTLDDVTVYDYTGQKQESSNEPTKQTLLIDQAKAFKITIDDISKAQSQIDLSTRYLGRSSIAVDLVKDTRILSHVAQVDAGNVISTSTITKDNIYSKFRNVMELLELANAIGSGGKAADGKKPYIIIDPKIASLLVKSPELTQATADGNKVIRTGYIGNVAGLDVLVCTNFSDSAGTYNILAGTNDAITFASQIVKVEKSRSKTQFADDYDGLYVYGSKMIEPTAAVKLVVTL